MVNPCWPRVEFVCRVCVCANVREDAEWRCARASVCAVEEIAHFKNTDSNPAPFKPALSHKYLKPDHLSSSLTTAGSFRRGLASDSPSSLASGTVPASQLSPSHPHHWSDPYSTAQYSGPRWQGAIMAAREAVTTRDQTRLDQGRTPPPDQSPARAVTP